MAADARDKSLEAALAQIDRQFGKGSVMRLGDEVRAPIEVIPTGSIALDVALGIGGLPRGRVVEIYGPESSGKCLTADALVPTNWGLLTVEEIFERCGQPASCTSRVSDIAHLGLQVINEHGELEPVAALTHNNRKLVFRVTTSTGKSVRVTANHPMRVLNGRGFVVWRQAADLEIDDVLVGVLGSDPDVKDQLTEREAVLLGYLVGDGHYTQPYAVMFSQVDEQVRAEFIDLMAEFDPSAAPVSYPDRPGDVWFRGKAMRDALAERYALTPANAAQKSVPPGVRASGPVVHRAFLSALFECDGGVEDDAITLSTASHRLATEVQAMLAGLGLVSSVRAKKVAAYPDNTYWTVALGNASSVRFVEEVGFRSARRAVQVTSMRPGTRDGATHIPHLAEILMDLRDSVGGDRAFDRIAGDVFRDFGAGHLDLAVTPQRLARVLGWAEERGVSGHPLVTHLRELAGRPATYERVVGVDPVGDEPTFDLVVPGTHSFVANGLAVHNTTVALHAVANAQRAGGIAAFIDAEHALDPDYAAKLGVDTDALLVSQPDTGEQALEIMDMLIRSGALDIVVIDSVAALVPRAEIEGEMGDSHVGLQARLMSQALRKITGALSQSGTTAIFINQLREKIGVMFGSPETTSGGRALKFYSSVRLDVRRIETLKDGTDAVGNRTRVKVVKNKVAPPFKQAEFDIIYGHGISREGGLIDMGVDQGFVRKSGAWYTYEGDQLGQGKENARAFLRDNPDLANEIEKKCKEKLGVGPRVDAPDVDLSDIKASDGEVSGKEPLPAPVDF